MPPIVASTATQALRDLIRRYDRSHRDGTAGEQIAPESLVAGVVAQCFSQVAATNAAKACGTA